jgi:hypothetical protein
LPSSVQALGAAVDLQKPVVLELPSAGNDVQVGLEHQSAATEAGEGPPAGWFELNSKQLELGRAVGHHQRQMGVGDGQTVAEELRAWLVLPAPGSSRLTS